MESYPKMSLEGMTERNEKLNFSAHYYSIMSICRPIVSYPSSSMIFFTIVFNQN